MTRKGQSCITVERIVLVPSIVGGLAMVLLATVQGRGCFHFPSFHELLGGRLLNQLPLQLQ